MPPSPVSHNVASRVPCPVSLVPYLASYSENPRRRRDHGFRGWVVGCSSDGWLSVQATKINKTTKREDDMDEMGADAEVHDDRDVDGVTGVTPRVVRVSHQVQVQSVPTHAVHASAGTGKR